MYRTVQLVLVGFLAVLFGMSALSRRFPHIAWLQLFRYNAPRLSEEQRANLRQRANVHAGIELILLGIVVPMVYFASTVIMFSEPTVTGTDRKSTRLNSSHRCISYAVFCLKKKKKENKK